MASSSEWPAVVRAWLRKIGDADATERAIASLRSADREWEPVAAYVSSVARVRQEMNWPPFDPSQCNCRTVDEAATLQLLANHRYAMLCHFTGHKAIEKAALEHGPSAAARSVLLAEQVGDDALAAFYRGVAARAYWLRGELPTARQLLQQSIETSQRLVEAGQEEFVSIAAVDLGNLAHIEKAAGDLHAASSASAAAVTILDALGSTQPGLIMQRCKTLMDLGTFTFALEEHARSRDAFDRAAEDARALAVLHPHPVLERMIVEALSDGASARFELQDFSGGRARLLEGETLIGRWPEDDEQLMVSAGKLLNSLAYAEKQIGDLQAAKRAAERALAVRRRLFDRDPRRHRANLTMTLNLLAGIERAIDSTATARYAEAWAVEAATPVATRQSPALPAWTEHARQFFALRHYQDLDRAIDACDDERIRAFLRAIAPLRSPGHPHETLMQALANEGRRTEAALVSCLFNLSELEKLAFQESHLISAVRGFEPEPFLALAKLAEDNDLHDCAAAILFLTGKLLCELLDDARGHDVLVRARADLEASGRRTQLMTLHASILNSIGAALRGLRDAAGAAAVLREAVELRRTLAADGDELETKFLANALYNLGNALMASNDPAAAACLRDALAGYRRLDDDTLALQAKCLCLLGVEAGRRQDPAMLTWFGEALQCARTAHQRQADLVSEVTHAAALAAYDPILVSTLLDVAHALLKTNQWLTARPLVDEVRDTLDQLPPAVRRHLARFDSAAADLHAELLRRLRRDEEATAAAQQAIAVAEHAEIAPGHRHQLKGPIGDAYRARLRQRAEAGDAAGVYSALCSLRNGSFVETTDDFAATLGAGLERLAAAEQTTDRRIVVLIAQRLGDRTLLAVLTSSGLASAAMAREFIAASTALWLRLEEIVAGDTGDEDEMAELAELGSAAWDALPHELRETLARALREERTDVLISGDDYWSAFPWEALLPSSSETEPSWLGLTRVLARWSDLSPAGLASLRPVSFGDGAPVAAVVSPWDALETYVLPGALAESRAVASALGRRGYLLIEDGVIAGARATSQMLVDAIAQEPAVLHFCGHGAIARGEEVLVTAGGHFFGSAELREYCRRHGAPRVFRGNPLAVLNCCDAGRVRSFGGEREDLAGLLLAQGCAAVIAWPVEVDDAIGARMGQLLYDRPGRPGAVMGEQVIHARRTIAAEFPDQPSWMFFQYHGNPYASMPV